MVVSWHLQAQRRGATRFISSPDELTEWDSHKTAAVIMSRADVVPHDSVQSTRRGRYRMTTERSTISSSSLSAETVSDFKTAKVPVYRVRGRNRSFKQDTGNDKHLAESTTVKPSSESNNRTVRRKSYQSNKQRTITHNENQSIETNNNSSNNENKEAVSSTYHATQTTSSRKYQTETESKSTTELPSNHQPENHRKNYGDSTVTRKSPTGRRYRIRVVEANSINANAQTVESEKKATSSSAITDNQKAKAKNPDRETVDEEQNYPEHFKVLLKSKKSTISPQTGSSRTNNFVPKKQTASTTAAPAELKSTIRPPYKHKKIERPNLKLLFPSLHTSTTTSDSVTVGATAIETDQTATDEANTETNTPLDVSSTTVKIKSAVNKQIGGLKFSSKIRTDGEDSLAAYRSKSTPLVFDTLKTSTQRTPNKPDSQPTNHRLSTVS